MNAILDIPVSGIPFHWVKSLKRKIVHPKYKKILLIKGDTKLANVTNIV